MTKLTDVLEYIDSCSDKQWLKFCELMENRGYIIEGKYLHDYNYPRVIRCKECKHARKCYGDVVWVSKGGGYIYKSLGTDGFCSRAERKEE